MKLAKKKPETGLPTIYIKRAKKKEENTNGHRILCGCHFASAGWMVYGHCVMPGLATQILVAHEVEMAAFLDDIVVRPGVDRAHSRALAQLMHQLCRFYLLGKEGIIRLGRTRFFLVDVCVSFYHHR